MSRSMAYLMHVDWNWIKQRPHFLAEELSACFDLDLYYIKNYKHRNKITNEMTAAWMSVQKLTKVPFSSRTKTLRLVEGVVNSTRLKKLYSEPFDYVWITSPIVLQFINLSRLRDSTIIYDCMDDILAFPQNEDSKAYVENLEQQILQRADIVLASSASLRQKMIDRGALNEVYLVNNAVSSAVVEVRNVSKGFQEKNKPLFSIVYFGTIAAWLDFSVIMELLNRDLDVEITLIGPVETDIPRHDRLHAIGPVEHGKLKDFADKADAFIMPFVVNDLIESVDPVKVYEYLSFGKPSLIVRYSETLKFEPYVYLYTGMDELVQWVCHIKNHRGMKASAHETLNFVKQNTWKQRTAQILEVISRVENGIK